MYIPYPLTILYWTLKILLRGQIPSYMFFTTIFFLNFKRKKKKKGIPTYGVGIYKVG